MSNNFINGDNIIYCYTHHLNRRASFINCKPGIFIRKIKMKNCNIYDELDHKVAIKLDNNKGISVVRISKIRHA